MSLSAKVMLLGDIGVGKSSLAKRLIFGRFETDYKTTIGVDVLTHDLVLGDGRSVKLLIWDTDGDFGHHIFKSVYISGASGAIVVGDASRPGTIEKMFDLAAAFNEKMPGRAVRAIINKTDILMPDLSAFDTKGLPVKDVLFSSAKTGEGVEAAFLSVANDIARRMDVD